MNLPCRILAVALPALSMARASDADLFARSGEYAEAARLYLEDIGKAANPTEALKARLNAASCLKFSGDICAAIRVLTDGTHLLEQVPGETTRALFLSEMGSVISLSRHPSQAIPILNRAAAMAEKLGEDALLAEIRNDTGIACGASGMMDEAYAWYSSAMQLAAKTKQEELTIRTRQNRLVSAYQIWKRDQEELTLIEEIDGWKQPVERKLNASADRFRRCLAESGAARSGDKNSPLLLFESITAGSAAVRFGMEREGFEMLRQALDTARTANAPELERSALLALAELYVARERFDDADLLLDHMRRLSPWEVPAHEAGLEILSARIAMHRKKSIAEARTRIDKAIRVVEALRGDLSASQQTSDLGRSFREWAGQPYLMLAELELWEKDAKAIESARNAVESFKAWELEDFYRDDCVNVVEGMKKNLAKLPDPTVAIFYVIPLESRTEILLGTSSGTKRVTVPITEKNLSRMVRRFRHHLEFDHGTFAFMEEAQSLYQLLISPMEKELESSGIRHLVFIPDGPLGNIPLAALRNPRNGKYLIQSFSLSIAPSFSMIGTATTDKPRTQGPARRCQRCGSGIRRTACRGGRIEKHRPDLPEPLPEAEFRLHPEADARRSADRPGGHHPHRLPRRVSQRGG